MRVPVKILPHYDSQFPLPSAQSIGAAGLDIRAMLPGGEGSSLKISPKERILVPTGLAVEIPLGYEMQVRPRSGTSLKTGLFIINAPGTIDADYRGEVQIIVGNWGDSEEIIRHGERIAQVLLAPVLSFEFCPTENLSTTERGDGGFGSTGKF
jgi:dUTP pyrophosphatase